MFIHIDRVLKQFGQAVWVVEVTIRTRSLTYARLRWRQMRAPRRSPGRFRFPFGVLRYVDASSLVGQYLEIFIERGYEVLDLPPAPRIVDCGGNIGLSAIWFKRRYPQSTITVYEADPSIGDILAGNVRRLGLSGIEVCRVAVSNRAGQVKFQTDGADGGHVNSDIGTAVPAIRLSDQLEEPVDILKIDIEGSEFALIADLCATGRIALVRHLICEVHTGHSTQSQVAQIWSSLTAAGFRITLRSVQPAPKLPGRPEPTPFAALATAKSLLLLYAWRP
jgi:FkbM family methyltransferase